MFFGKWFGNSTAKKTNGFRVSLRVPISYSAPKSKPVTEGVYPNALLLLRPGMSKEKAQEILQSSGSALSLDQIFHDASNHSLSWQVDKSDFIRNIFFSNFILDDVEVVGLKLRMPLQAALGAKPNLKPDKTQNKKTKDTLFVSDFTYFKMIEDGIEVSIVVRDQKVTGINLKTPGWIYNANAL